MPVADSGLRKVVQQHLKKSNGWLWTPIETAGTHQGVPDSFWAHDESRTCGWVEHKATEGWMVKIRPLQVAWIERHAHVGVHCTIMVRAKGVGSSGGRGDSLWVLAGIFARDLVDHGLNNMPRRSILGYWAGPPAEWNWRAIQQILTHAQ
jgi:hypothetical protein